MKTAISIPDDLFEDVTRLAEEENISRSKVFSDAVREYIEKRNNQKLLAALNDAYSHKGTVEEKKFRARTKRYYAEKILKDKW